MTNKEKKEMQQAIEDYRAALKTLEDAKLAELQKWHSLKYIVGRDKADWFKREFEQEIEDEWLKPMMAKLKK